MKKLYVFVSLFFYITTIIDAADTRKIDQNPGFF